MILRKFLIAVFLVVLLSLSSFAAFPQEINYQGKLLDSGGTPLTGTYSVLFAIYDAPSGGTILWSETQSVSVESGIFNVLLGSNTPITTEAFDGSDRWLGIKVGADAEMTPRHKLVSVGNAFHAYNADKLDGHDWSEVPSTGSFVQKTGDTMTGPLTFEGVTYDISTVSNQNLALMPNGTGRVGVGTISPAEKLHVAGKIKADDTFFGTNIYLMQNGPDVLLTLYGDNVGSTWTIGNEDSQNGDLIFSNSSTLGSPKIIVTQPQGRVGIGTTLPTSLLTVTGTIESTIGGIKFPDGTLQTTAATGAATGNFVELGPTSVQSTKAAYAVYVETSDTSGRAVFGNATATGALWNYGGYFLAGGNEGRAVYGEVGGSSASAVQGTATHTTGITYGGEFTSYSPNGVGVSGYNSSGGVGVRGGTTGSGKAFYGVNYSASGYAGYFDGGVFAGGAGYGISAEATSSGGRAVFGNATATGALWNYGGYFLAGGNEGRAVYGEVGGSSASAVQGTATHTTGITYGGEFTSYSPNGVGVSGYNSSGGVGVRGGTTGSGKAFYGVNYNSSGYAGYFDGRLYVNGSIEVESMPTGTYNTVYYDTSTGIFYRSASSRKYKDQIKLFSADFNKILKAEPKSYINKSTGDPNIGYIAEEFDEIGLKELVIYDEQGRPDALKYDRIPLYLLEVIKDQRKEIEDLKSRLEAVEAKLK